MNYKTISRDDLRIGDEVQIANGDWFMIEELNRHRITVSCYTGIPQFSDILTGFRRKCEEQVTEKWLPIINLTEFPDLNDCEQYLQQTYGSPPVVHTYNGEPAEVFGLNENSFVLVRTPICWESVIFCGMAKGDKWMKQPKEPK